MESNPFHSFAFLQDREVLRGDSNIFSIPSNMCGSGLGTTSWGTLVRPMSGVASIPHAPTYACSPQSASPTPSLPPKLTKPKRPLTAYNLFFRSERAKMIGVDPCTLENKDRGAPRKKRAHRKTHGKISFMDLAKCVGKKWKLLDPASREVFEAQAAVERKRYKKEMELYKQSLHSANGGVVGQQGTSPFKCIRPPCPPYPDELISLKQTCLEQAPVSLETKVSMIIGKHLTSIPPLRSSESYHSTLTRALQICERDDKKEESCEPLSASDGSIGNIEKDLMSTLGDDVIDFLTTLEGEDLSSSQSNNRTGACHNAEDDLFTNNKEHSNSTVSSDISKCLARAENFFDSFTDDIPCGTKVDFDDKNGLGMDLFSVGY